MNERIKELAKQTGHIWHASGDPQVYEFTPEKLEKFAELIVRECVRVAMRSVDDAEPKEAWYLIEEHFGVKL